MAENPWTNGPYRIHFHVWIVVATETNHGQAVALTPSGRYEFLIQTRLVSLFAPHVRSSERLRCSEPSLTTFATTS